MPELDCCSKNTILKTDTFIMSYGFGQESALDKSNENQTALKMWYQGILFLKSHGSENCQVSLESS